MSTKKVRKFIRHMKGPLKILARARDFYVRSMTSCAGNAAYGSAAVGVPTLHFPGLPRSFSTNSSYSDYSSREEDLRELIRIASCRRCVTECRRSPGSGAGGGVAVVSRSRTVAIGRIDEDKACEFGGDEGAAGTEVYPRSRSYAPSTSISMV